LFFKSTHLVHPCTPHHGGTPLQNSGTPWGVRYTRLTSTALAYHSLNTMQLWPSTTQDQHKAMLLNQFLKLFCESSTRLLSKSGEISLWTSQIYS